MTDTAPTTAPAETALTLEPPASVPAIPATQAGSMVPLDDAVVPALDAKVAAWVEALSECDPHTPELDARSKDVQALGSDDIRKAAETSSRLLSSPLRKMGRHDGGAKVSETLVELRRTVAGLDPKGGSGVRKVIGKLPFGGKMSDYFARYEPAQAHLNAIIAALRAGQDALRKDNAAIELEKQRLWEAMGRLTQYAYVAGRLDESLTAKVAELEADDPERARALRDDVLFYVRQKHQDLLTQLAVSAQGYLAMDLVRRNNTELVKGVERATTTTVAALRTAVLVAQALSNQRLVLDQVTAISTTTSELVESTSKMLSTQTADIQSQAAGATVGIEQLQAAFNNVYETMDAIDTFKAQALDAMTTTIASLQDEIDRSQTRLARVNQAGAEQPDASGAFELDRA